MSSCRTARQFVCAEWGAACSSQWYQASLQDHLRMRLATLSGVRRDFTNPLEGRPGAALDLLVPLSLELELSDVVVAAHV